MSLTPTQIEKLASTLADDLYQAQAEITEEIGLIYHQAGLALEANPQQKKEIIFFYSLIESAACLAAFPDREDGTQLGEQFIAALVRTFAADPSLEKELLQRYDQFSQVFELAALSQNKGQFQLAKQLSQRLGLPLASQEPILVQNLADFFRSTLDEEKETITFLAKQNVSS